MARASGVTLALDTAAVPLLSRAREWARDGRVTGASARNWLSVAEGVDLPPGQPRWERDILTDPQTSGGLLAAVASRNATQCLETIRAAGFAQAAIIGEARAGLGRVTISNPEATG